MEELGVMWEPLAEEVGKNIGPFDLICHVAFGQPPLTRKERADNVRKRNYFTKYGDQARIVLDALLDKYADGQMGDLLLNLRQACIRNWFGFIHLKMAMVELQDFY